jgi:glutamate-1-semialdehyde 2,1-aminomutase
MAGGSTPKTTNADMLEHIREVIAGGVSSNMRALAIPSPIVLERSEGCRLWDVEGNELIDLNMGYGPHLFGYADADLFGELSRQFTLGHMTGIPHRLDQRAGELIREFVPSIEQLRFANSGTEALMSAVRLARAHTDRTLILTFEGHYHGWSETLLRKFKPFDRTAEEAEATPHVGAVRPEPGAAGMIPGALDHTVQARWNDLESVRNAFAEYGDRIAGVILEPVLANAGVVAPAPGFLEQLREITTRHGALLIFDEVITGFRVGRGGAQERYGVHPDITVLSKVLGGGYPVSAFGGSRAVMAAMANNKAFHAGVYAGSHTASRAVVTMLEKIGRSEGIYERLESISAYAQARMQEMLADVGQHAWISRVGSILSVALLTRPVADGTSLYELLAAVDFRKNREWQIRSQHEGVYFHPNPLEPWFLSAAHTTEDIDVAVETLQKALIELQA